MAPLQRRAFTRVRLWGEPGGAQIRTDIRKDGAELPVAISPLQALRDAILRQMARHEWLFAALARGSSHQRWRPGPARGSSQRPQVQGRTLRFLRQARQPGEDFDQF